MWTGIFNSNTIHPVGSARTAPSHPQKVRKVARTKRPAKVGLSRGRWRVSPRVGLYLGRMTVVAKKTPKRKKKASGRKRSDPLVITLHYDLHELPTAQHKAGLAGLLLQIDSMYERRDAGALPEDTSIPWFSIGSRCATVWLTQRSLHETLVDLYDAEELNGKTFPAGRFLERFTCDGNEQWQKLWRDMVWLIPRGRPKSRGIYAPRQNRDANWKVSTDLWTGLVAGSLNAIKPKIKLMALTESLLLGSQGKSAESLEFQERPEYVLLLHFWSLTCGIFVPEWINGDGDAYDAGFGVAFPDVVSLNTFIRRYKNALFFLDRNVRHARRRVPSDSKSRWDSRRPEGAVVSVPAEGIAEFLVHIADLTPTKTQRAVRAVEYWHCGKQSDLDPKKRRSPQESTLVVNHDCLAADESLLCAIAGIAHAYRNTLFRSCRALSLLRARPWFEDFQASLDNREWSFFVHSTQERHQTPSGMRSFAWDAAQRFTTLEKNYHKKKEADMPDLDGTSDSVDRLVYDLVRSYVRIRAARRLASKQRQKITSGGKRMDGRKRLNKGATLHQSFFSNCVLVEARILFATSPRPWARCRSGSPKTGSFASPRH